MILHLNLSISGIGRYGQALGTWLHQEAASRGNLRVLSVFDASMRDGATVPDAVFLNWNGGWVSKIGAMLSLLLLLARHRPHAIVDSSGSNAKNALLWPFYRMVAPLYAVEHDPAPHVGSTEGELMHLSRHMLRRLARRVFVHGSRNAAALEDLGFNRRRIRIIHHGSLLPATTLEHLPQRQKNHLLFFGEIRYNKGFDLLPDILRLVTRQVGAVSLTVAGAVPLSNDSVGWLSRVDAVLDELKALLPITARVGYVPERDVPTLFAEAGVVLLPYREATQSGVAMLALPSGCHVVTTDVGDVREAVDPDRRLHVCPANPEEIAACLVDVLQSTSYLEDVQEIRTDDFGWRFSARVILDSIAGKE